MSSVRLILWYTVCYECCLLLLLLPLLLLLSLTGGHSLLIDRFGVVASLVSHLSVYVHAFCETCWHLLSPWQWISTFNPIAGTSLHTAQVPLRSDCHGTEPLMECSVQGAVGCS